jgi:hypothetical protein
MYAVKKRASGPGALQGLADVGCGRGCSTHHPVAAWTAAEAAQVSSEADVQRHLRAIGVHRRPGFSTPRPIAPVIYRTGTPFAATAGWPTWMETTWDP